MILVSLVDFVISLSVPRVGGGDPGESVDRQGRIACSPRRRG